MKLSIFLALLVMTGCARVHPVACGAKWSGPIDVGTGVGQQWFYIGSDHREYANVTTFPLMGPSYTAWHNGRDYGDFTTLDAAKKHAEEIACKYGEDTF